MPEAGPQISSFTRDAIRRYDELKLEVGAIAQSAMLLCAKAKDEQGERALRQILARLAEDRFNLAVVGPFSRGKSSLMNAILGLDALPTSLLPHTSVVTTVTYGPRERVLVRCEGWSLAQEIRLNQLEEYVTERGNPGNRRRVSVAEIQLPVEILRRGLHFIDTPGVGSAILANTETTEKSLPEIDAAIFVSTFDSVLGESDIEFLRRLRATVGVVFVVLNKLDLVSNSEAEQVARFAREQFDRDPRIGHCPLFSTSAKLALEAKRAGDPDALARSGLPELEATLARFLATDKARQLGARVMDRLIACLQKKPENFEALLTRAQKRRREFENPKECEFLAPGNGSSEIASGVSKTVGIKSVRTCPICRAIVRAVFEYLSKLQYELSTGASAQQDHADAGGFCPAHTWIYSSLASPVGISRAYPPLLDLLATKLDLAVRNASSPEALASEVRDISPSQRKCAVCELRYRTAREAIGEVVKRLDPSGESEIPALCLPHLELAPRCGTDMENGRLLALACARALSRLADDMRRYALKYDAVRRDLMTTDEREAAQAGLRKLASEMLLVLPRREDDRL
jgi:GTP-binding protein EngB required for normal cell division